MTLRVDDEKIKDEEFLWRRIIPSPIWVTVNDDSSLVLSSASFLDGHTNEVSCHRAKLADLKAITEKYPEHGVAQIQVGEIRALGYMVVSDPTKEDQSHTLIVSSDSDLSKKRRKKNAKIMASKASWIVEPQLDSH